MRQISKEKWGAAALILLAACSVPPMEPLTEGALDAAEHRWGARGVDAYHLVVRVRPPRADPAVYDLMVARGAIARVARDGQALPPDETDDYSVPGLFHLLREELQLVDGRRPEAARPVDLRAQFEPDTGRLKRYCRTVGTSRRRVLLIEVLEYEPLSSMRQEGAVR
jgi:hypothetical protein